jgi:hypothetical protein
MQTATAKPEQIFDLRWMSAFLISIAIIWAICFSASIFIFKESKKNSVMQAMINTFTDMGGMGIPFWGSVPKSQNMLGLILQAKIAFLYLDKINRIIKLEILLFIRLSNSFGEFKITYVFLTLF